MKRLPLRLVPLVAVLTALVGINGSIYALWKSVRFLKISPEALSGYWKPGTWSLELHLVIGCLYAILAVSAVMLFFLLFHWLDDFPKTAEELHRDISEFSSTAVFLSLMIISSWPLVVPVVGLFLLVSGGMAMIAVFWAPVMFFSMHWALEKRKELMACPLT